MEWPFGKKTKGKGGKVKSESQLMERLNDTARIIAGLEKNEPENVRDVMIQYAVARALVWALEADEMVMWNAIGAAE